MDEEIITDEIEDTDPAGETEEPVSYTAEEMYMLATQNQEDFSSYYKAIYAAAESGKFDILFGSVSPALSKDLKAKGYSISFNAWDGNYKVSWK